jgi:hypothetical protein
MHDCKHVSHQGSGKQANICVHVLVVIWKEKEGVLLMNEGFREHVLLRFKWHEILD